MDLFIQSTIHTRQHTDHLSCPHEHSGRDLHTHAQINMIYNKAHYALCTKPYWMSNPSNNIIFTALSFYIHIHRYQIFSYQFFILASTFSSFCFLALLIPSFTTSYATLKKILCHVGKGIIISLLYSAY